jgi:hypothetical protein
MYVKGIKLMKVEIKKLMKKKLEIIMKKMKG